MFGSYIITLCRLTTYIYICCTAPLTSRRSVLNIYSTNIRTEFFKHAASSPFFIHHDTDRPVKENGGNTVVVLGEQDHSEVCIHIWHSLYIHSITGI
jgi:hypothetical protein